MGYCRKRAECSDLHAGFDRFFFCFVRTDCPGKNDKGYAVHDGSHQAGGGHVNHGVLFDEHGGKNNKEHQHQGSGFDLPAVLQQRTDTQGDMHADCVIYMQAGQYIRRRVGTVHGLYQRCAEILPWEDLGPEIETVRIQTGYNKENCHSSQKIHSHFPAGGSVFDGNEYRDDTHIAEPGIIGENEVFTEWDPVIQRGVDDMIIGGNGRFQICEPGRVDKDIKAQEELLVVF